MKKSIACIGQGFVGGSLTTVFSERGFVVYGFDKSGKQAPGSTFISGAHFIHTLDPSRNAVLAGLDEAPRDPSEGKDPGKGYLHGFIGSVESTQGFSGIYFVCVPTPMFDNGEADTSIVEDVLAELASVPSTKPRIAVVKSTVPPGSTEKWNKQFEGTPLKVVFNPEFLTEANALDDMRKQNRIVLGGPRPWINQVKQMFQTAFPNVPIVKTSSTTAEMVKYFTNVHLAARVVLSCELAQVCEALDKKGMNVDYDKVLEYAKYDHRLGGSHMNVPGSDGIPGSRGHCFPKDLSALIAVASNLGIKPTVMSAVREKNDEIVPTEHRDWEKMYGRAVSKKRSNDR